MITIVEHEVEKGWYPQSRLIDSKGYVRIRQLACSDELDLELA